MYGIFVWNISTEYFQKFTFLKKLRSGQHSTLPPNRWCAGQDRS